MSHVRQPTRHVHPVAFRRMCPAVAFLLVFSALALPHTARADGPDVNWDNSVDVLDIQRAANLILLQDVPFRPDEADVDLDGSRTVNDIQIIVNQILGVAAPLTSRIPAVLPHAVEHFPWQFRLQTTGGTGQVSWSSSGLPAWLTLDTNGWLSGTPPNLQTDTVTFTGVDGLGARVTATVIVTVGDINRAPIAMPDHYPVPATGNLVVAATGVFENDHDEDTDVLSAILVSPATQGSVLLGVEGGFTYTPPAVPVGTHATFEYRAGDGRGGFSNATVYLWFGNAAPRVMVYETEMIAGTLVGGVQLQYWMGERVLESARDPDSDPMSAALVTPPAEGTMSIAADGKISYTIPRTHPGGVFTYVFSVSDGVTPIPALGLGRIVVKPVSEQSPSITILSGYPTAPIQAGSTHTVTVRVGDAGTSHALAYDHIDSVFIDGTPFGLPGPIPMTFVAVDGRAHSDYTATFATSPGMAYGLHSVNVHAVNKSQKTGTTAFDVISYIGPPLMSSSFTSVQAAVNACPDFGAVLFAAGSSSISGIPATSGPQWSGPGGLIANKPIVLGVVPAALGSSNYHFVVLSQNVPIFAPGGTHDGLIVFGLSFSNGSANPHAIQPPAASPTVIPTSSKIVLTSSPLFYGVDFIAMRSAGNGGLINAGGPGVILRLHRCGISAIANEVATTAPLKGGWFYIHSGASADIHGAWGHPASSATTNSIGPVFGGALCFEGGSGGLLNMVDGNLLLARSSPPSVYGETMVVGGSVCIDGGTAVLDQSSIGANVATSPSGQVFGGALAVIGGANVTSVWGIHSGTVTGGSLCLGGAVYVAGGSSMVLNKGQTHGSVNAAAAGGGGVAVADDSLMRIEHGRVNGTTTGIGAGIWMDAAPTGAPLGTFPTVRSGGAVLSLFNLGIGGTATGPGAAGIHVGDSSPGAPIPSIDLTNVSMILGSAPANGGFAFERGHVTMIDSVIASCSGTPFSHNSSRGTLAYSHIVAPLGAIPGFMPGLGGNKAAVEFVVSLNYLQPALNSGYYTHLRNAGSTSAVTRGLHGIGIGPNSFFDLGRIDIGAHDVLGMNWSFDRYSAQTAPSVTPQQLRLNHP